MPSPDHVQDDRPTEQPASDLTPVGRVQVVPVTNRHSAGPLPKFGACRASSGANQVVKAAAATSRKGPPCQKNPGFARGPPAVPHCGFKRRSITVEAIRATTVGVALHCASGNAYGGQKIDDAAGIRRSGPSPVTVLAFLERVHCHSLGWNNRRSLTGLVSGSVSNSPGTDTKGAEAVVHVCKQFEPSDIVTVPIASGPLQARDTQ